MNGQAAYGKFFGMVAVVFLAFGVFFVQVDKSHAQILPISGVQLLSNPQFPSPNSQVRVSLDDYSVNTLGSTIAWYVNGVERKEFSNERSVLVNVGDFGEKTTVRATLTRPGTAPLSATTVLAPSVVDVVIEANTYVPSFYKGRALPSDGSTARAIAIVHDGMNTSDSAYTYRWLHGGNVLLGGPMKGKNVIDISVSYHTDPLSVEVFDANGSLVGRGMAELVVVEPELHFYENSPLRGLSEKEAADPYMLVSDETTMFGEPYYFDMIDMRDAEFTWKINGATAVSNEEAPNAITIKSSGKGGATLGLTAITGRTIPQYLQKAIQLVFQ